MSITDAFELYRLDVIVFKNQSGKTEENHFVCMRAVLEYFGNVEIESLTFDGIRDWKIHLDKTRSPATVRNYIIRLRVVLIRMRVRGLSVVDGDSIPVPKRIDKVPEVLTPEEVSLLIRSTARIKNKAIISLLYSAGLRISELCSLDRAQMSKDTFTVVGKGGKARLCFVDERTKVLIDLYLDTRADKRSPLFLTEAGLRITPATVQDTFRSVRKISGLEVHPHTLRHSYATNLMQNGMHIYSLSRLMGHSSIQTTSVYLHVTDPQLHDEYKKHHTYS